jgi:hypothetical protein
MTTQKPPKFFSSIFNSYYYTEDTATGLTQAEADLRYLKKTITDTATALETFNAGIKTNTIDNVNNTDVTNILINSTGNINIGSSASRTTSNPIVIGNSTNSIIRLGSTGLSFSTLGTPTATLQSIATSGILAQTPTATMSLFSNQTGILNIGAVTNRTGNINIANTQTTGTGNIVIGSSALTTGTQDITINRPLTFGYTYASSFNQLGYYEQFTGSAITISSSPTAYTQLLATTAIPQGIYHITYHLTTTPATTIVFSKRFFGITPDPTGVLQTATGYQEYSKSETFTGSTSEVFNTTSKITTSGAYYFLFRATVTSGTGTATGILNFARIG